MAKDWLIHPKPHLNKPEPVVRYLVCYTHLTAISPARIVAVDDTSVSFKWKDYRDQQQKIMTLEGSDFLHRFCTARAAQVTNADTPLWLSGQPGA